MLCVVIDRFVKEVESFGIMKPCLCYSETDLLQNSGQNRRTKTSWLKKSHETITYFNMSLDRPVLRNSMILHFKGASVEQEFYKLFSSASTWDYNSKQKYVSNNEVAGKWGPWNIC